MEEQPPARSPAAGVVVETVEHGVSGFRGSNGPPVLKEEVDSRGDLAVAAV